MSYETFEHTADIGLRAFGATLEEVFAEAGHAMFSVIVQQLDEVRTTATVEIDLAAERLDDLLHDWLAELLYHFDAHRMVFKKYELKIVDGRLRGWAHGEPLDPSRHLLGMEIKAVTYHELKLEASADGWAAEVIVDL